MLSLDRVTKTYRVGAFGREQLTAVRDVSFTVRRDEVVSLIGESGSGKTTIGRMILGLNSATTGTITFQGTDVRTLKGHRLRDYYRHVQGVFQDPFSSFNPIFRADRVFEMVHDRYFPAVDRRTWTDRTDRALTDVALDPDQVRGKYPHQLSGGQLQRMLIARALLLDIDLLVADEIVSMVDASTRIDVLNLLAGLKARGLGILFITHDLALGNYLSATTVILRHGMIVEMGATAEVFGDPRHPYTRALVAAVPQLHRKWTGASGDGSVTADHCDYHAHLPGTCEDPTAGTRPALTAIGSGHLVACARAGSRPVTAGRRATA